MVLINNTVYTSTLQGFGCALSDAVQVNISQQPNLHPITEDECTAMTYSVDDLNCVFEQPKCDTIRIYTNGPGTGIKLPVNTTMFGTYRVGPNTWTDAIPINTAVINKLLWMEFYDFPLKWNNAYPAFSIDDFYYWQFHKDWTPANQMKNQLNKSCGFPFCGTCMVDFTLDPIERSDGYFHMNYTSVKYTNGTLVPESDTATLAPLMYFAIHYGCLEPPNYGFAPYPFPNALVPNNLTPVTFFGQLNEECRGDDCSVPWDYHAGGLPGCAQVNYPALTVGCYPCTPGSVPRPGASIDTPSFTNAPTTVESASGIGIDGKKARAAVGVIFAFFGITLYVGVIYFVVQYYRSRSAHTGAKYVQLYETDAPYV